MSVGRLAAELGMSKSAVFAHFGSMETLQLATVELAARIYAAEIVQPALAEPPGIARLTRLIDAFLSYSERHVFPGGCFFGTTVVEYGSRPGRIRDRLAQAHLDWIGVISGLLTEAQRDGDVELSADVDQLAFEIGSLLTTADWLYNLHEDAGALERGRRAVMDRLGGVLTDRAHVARGRLAGWPG